MSCKLKLKYVWETLKLDQFVGSKNPRMFSYVQNLDIIPKNARNSSPKDKRFNEHDTLLGSTKNVYRSNHEMQ